MALMDAEGVGSELVLWGIFRCVGAVRRFCKLRAPGCAREMHR